jgi:8-oxo-dGTP pyrophosphatase MutT (NUDIX family)
MTMRKTRFKGACSPAVVFFALWVLTVLCFSYQQVKIHQHYAAKLSSSSSLLDRQHDITGSPTYRSHTVQGDSELSSVYASSEKLAAVATTIFNPPVGHCAPFWSKETGELRTVSTKTLFESQFCRLEMHSVQVGGENGKLVKDWAWFEEPDQVNVAVQMSDGKMMLFRQSKYGLEADSLAPVGGMIERGEFPLKAAKRETREELHVTCSQWTFLGRFRVATNRGGGFCNSFLAQGCDPVEEIMENPFDYEKQVVERYQVDQLRNALRRNVVGEIKWVATFALAWV